MRPGHRSFGQTSLVGVVMIIGLTMLAQGRGPAPSQDQAPGQGRGRGQGGTGGGGGGRGGAPAAIPPQNLTAVVLPTVTGPITGPGMPYESVQSLAPGKGLATFNYQAKEYFISGTANGQPYKTRIVVRRPSSNAKFSGMVLVEPMHPSGSAHMFEMTSIYTMTSGHAAVDISAAALQQVIDANPERYQGFQVGNAQISEIIAQVGALVKSKDPSSPFAGLTVKKMVLGGTSATAGTLIAYLPFHMVLRTPDMQRIYDGFMPTSNGSVIRQIDVPMIHVPTMLEVSNANITTRPDGDAPGDQYRVYEFPGMGHVDSRDNVRLTPNPCAIPLSTFPMQAYMSIGLDYLFQWVDKGIAPPRADRIVKEGSAMALDERGNPKGGIRSPYVDVPVTKYGVPNRGADPLPASLSAYITRGGQQAANQMCGLSAFQNDYSRDELKKIYGNKETYKNKFARRLSELEKAGWSLSMYHDMILSDVARAEF
jgi:hypothetical protein